MWIFAGVPWRGGVRGVNDSGVLKNVDFCAFVRYIFGTLGNKANVIIYSVTIFNLVPHRLCTDPKVRDLE